MLLTDSSSITSRMCLIKLWAHEMNRVFSDRLIDKTDKEEAEKIIKNGLFCFNEIIDNEPINNQQVVEENNDNNHDYNSLQRSLDIVPKDQVDIEEEEIVNLNQIDLDVLSAMET